MTRDLGFLTLTAFLQTPHVGQYGHPAIQRQDFHAGPRIVIGDEAVQQPCAAGRPKGIND